MPCLYPRGQHDRLSFVASRLRGLEALLFFYSGFASISRFSEIAFWHPDCFNRMAVGECH